MKDKSVKDIMVPLSEYAVVDEDATIKDAFRILIDSRNKIPPGSHFHRAVLVKDKAGNIVGKIGHHRFLEALDPRYGILDNFNVLTHSEIAKKEISKEMDELGFWEHKLPMIKQRANEIKLKQAMEKVEEHIDENSSLSEAVHLLVQYRVLSLLTIRNNKVTGLVRLSDLFEEVAEFILAEE